MMDWYVVWIATLWLCGCMIAVVAHEKRLAVRPWLISRKKAKVNGRLVISGVIDPAPLQLLESRHSLARTLAPPATIPFWPDTL